MNKIIFTNNAPDWKIFSWVIGNVCNYKCSYCPENLHAGNFKYPSFENAIKVFKKFRGSEEQKVYYELVGGEPTLWPKLQDYLNAIHSKNTFVELNTNGSRTKRYWDHFTAPVDLFYISFHPESAIEEKFIQTIESLHERYRTHVTILLLPKLWNKCKNFFDYIFHERQDLKINVTFTLIRPNFKEEPEPYTDEMKEYFNMKKKNRAIPSTKIFPNMLVYRDRTINWRKFQYHKYNTFQGMYCNAPKERVYIAESGDIYHAACGVGGPIGNIYTGEYDRTKIEPIKCTKKICGCKFDALCSKFGDYEFDKIDLSHTYD